jgi:hypothetical protein
MRANRFGNFARRDDMTDYFDRRTFGQVLQPLNYDRVVVRQNDFNRHGKTNCQEQQCAPRKLELTILSPVMTVHEKCRQYENLVHGC